MTPHRPLARGVLVALEGIDGTGKSTQVKRLTTIFRAQGYAVLLLREPTNSPWGLRLREAMAAGRRVLAPSQELDLFLQDRRYDVAAHIKPALAEHKLVLIDRYYFSTIAYQGALGIDPQMIRRMNEAFAPVPDATFLLLISPAQALERIRQGRGQVHAAFEREDYLRKVDEVFRTVQGPHIYPITADQPIGDITAALQQKIQEILGAECMTLAGGSPLTSPASSSGRKE
jgi:dTMP kinase